MGSVIPLKKSANSAYLELKNLLGNKLEKVESYKNEHTGGEGPWRPTPPCGGLASNQEI